MSTTDIFQREAEFHKQNIELELKSHALFEQVDQVLKNENLVDISSKPTSPLSRSFVFTEGIDVGFEDGGKPAGLQSISKFFKSKIKKMQEEIKQMQVDYKKKCEVLRKLHADNKILEDEKIRLLQQLSAAGESLSKNEEQRANLTKALQIRDTENQCLRREVDQLKKDFRQQASMVSTMEVRLNRSLEEIDRLRSGMKEVQLEKKESRDKNLKDIQELRTRNKRLENQKSDLVNVVKRQIQLIDNLKRQKMHLETNKMMTIGEEEFLKILDWNLSDKGDIIYDRKIAK